MRDVSDIFKIGYGRRSVFKTPKQSVKRRIENRESRLVGVSIESYILESTTYAQHNLIS